MARSTPTFPEDRTTPTFPESDEEPPPPMPRGMTPNVFTAPIVQPAATIPVRVAPSSRSASIDVEEEEEEEDHCSSGFNDDGPIDAAFSDDEDLPPPPAPGGPPFVLSDGFDFSGSALADAGCDACALCGQPLEVSWDESRDSLVFEKAVMLRNQTFHIDCLAKLRGPPS